MLNIFCIALKPICQFVVELKKNSIQLKQIFNDFYPRTNPNPYFCTEATL